MIRKSEDGKFTIKVDECYLERSDSKYEEGNKTAEIELLAETATVTLYEISEAIKGAIFFFYLPRDICIDGNRFSMLNIKVIISKSKKTIVTYNFEIPNFQSESDILPEIAKYITL